MLGSLVSISRLHIVAIATLGALVFGWIFTGHYLAVAAGACALDWFVVNLMNRVADIKEDDLNGIAGTSFVARNKKPLLALGVFVLVASLLATLLLAPRITPLRLAFQTLGFAYNWKILPGGRRIKELYFWKNTASATGFIISVFGYPLAVASSMSEMTFASGVSVTTILVTALFFFLFEVSYEVLYDLRDAEGDAKLDVRTYAVVHGTRTAIVIAYALVGSSIAVLFVGYAVHVLPWRVLVMVAAPVVQIVYARFALARGITSKDCIRLTWIGAALLAAYIGWVELGLPGVRG